MWEFRSTATPRQTIDIDGALTERRRTIASPIAILQTESYKRIFGGFVAVIDVANDPVDTYKHLASFEPPTIRFVLPDRNWDDPVPPIDRVSYGQWLIEVFDCWFNAKRQTTSVEPFASILNLLLGGTSRCESLGLSPVALTVIDTDGTIEQVDYLKTAFEGAPATGLNAFENTFDEALTTPGIMARQIGSEALCDTCRTCPVAQVCGGGMYPHRYKTGTGFLNPSVYCADLFALISHIRNSFQDVLVQKGLIHAH